MYIITGDYQGNRIKRFSCSDLQAFTIINQLKRGKKCRDGRTKKGILKKVMQRLKASLNLKCVFWIILVVKRKGMERSSLESWSLCLQGISV